MAVTTTLVLLILTSLLHYSNADDKLAEEKEILDRILAGKHNNGIIRPQSQLNNSGPVIVETNMYIRKIKDIDDINMEYKIELTFRQKWHDSRLAFHDKNSKHTNYISLRNPADIWTPDVFFSNELEGHFHNILQPNTLLRIYPSGNVLYSIRISLKLTCPMDLSLYPFDTQTCSVILASYGATTEDLQFIWKQENPVQITKHLHLEVFKLSLFITDYCTSKTTTGEYSCIKLDLRFTRKLNSYLMRIYVPLTFMVIVSWITFWLDCREIMARVLIWATSLLFTCIVHSNFQSELPAPSTTKAIDVWCGACYTFLFAVILEIANVAQANYREAHARQLKPLANESSKDQDESSSIFAKVFKWIMGYPSRMQRIDVISRITFPLAFLIFNVIYWVTYNRTDEE